MAGNPSVRAYLGSSLTALTPVARQIWSHYGFAITPGTTYQIAVGDEEDTFDLILKASGPPANDNFVDRILLTGTNVSVTGSTFGATKETDEPDTTLSHSVWWSWTAPIAGRCVIQTSEVVDLRVYIGSSLSTLSPNLGGYFAITPGATYQIAAGDEYEYSYEYFRLSLTAAEAPEAPANDDFADRIILTGTNVSVMGSTLGATREGDEPNTTPWNSVWWSWTAPIVGIGVIETPRFGPSPALGVYRGSSLTVLTPVANLSPEPWHHYVFAITPGTTYQITAGGAEMYSFQFSLTAGAVPSNDNFSDRIILTGTNVSVSGSTFGATREADEPNSTGWNSVWWSWTAPVAGVCVLDTMGFDSVPALGVYVGSTLTALTPVANLIWNTSGDPYAFAITAGTTYQIAVGGAEHGFELFLGTRPPIPNDNFSSSTRITGTNVTATGSTEFATSEPGEPPHGPSYYDRTNSIWWSWTAPISGKTLIRVQGETYIFPKVDVYVGASLDSLSLMENINDTSVESRFIFRAVAGTTYHIAVTGSYYFAGAIELNLRIAPFPPNDDFVNSTPIDGTNVTVTGTCMGATREPREPRQMAGNSVWWSWTAPVSGGVTISTDGSDFDTTVSAYIGTSLARLKWVNADDNSGEGPRSKLAFNAIEGVTYYIAVAGFSDGINPSSEGNIVLHATMGAPATAPLTDPATLPDLKLLKEGSVTAFAAQVDGGMIISGNFFSVNGIARTNIARLNPNGSLDLSWNPAIDGYVGLLAINGNDLFVSGTFQSIGGVQRKGLAKVNLEDGQVDSHWDPDPIGPVIDEQVGRISAMVVIDDHLFVSGTFTSIGGQNRTNLAKLETTGTGRADELWDPDPNLGGASLAVFREQLILCGGRIAKIGSTGNGAADPIWNPSISGHNMAVSGTNLFILGWHSVRKVSLLGEGVTDPLWEFYVGENTKLIAASGDSVFVASVPINDIDTRPVLYKLRANATNNSRDSVWRVPIFRRPPYLNDAGRDIYPNKLVKMYALVPLGDKVLVGGNFRFVNDAAALGMVALDAVTGSIDDSFPANVEVPGSVLALARQQDGKLVIGGEFAFAGDLPRNNLARVNVDGTVDTAWRVDADGAVTALAANETDIYVAGVFKKIGRLNRQHLARISLATDSADPSWDPQPAPLRFGVTSPVQAMVALNTNLYVGGSFTSIGGQSIWGFCRINTVTGSADPGPFRTGDQKEISAMTLQSDGMLIIAGNFDTVAGVARPGLARVNGTAPSELDLQWAPRYDPAAMGRPVALALDATNLFVAGTNGISKYQLSGVGDQDPAWERPDIFSAGIKSLAVAGQNLYVGGLFWPIGFPTVAAGGEGMSMLARLDKTTGETLAVWNKGLVYTLLEANGDLYVGGEFTRFGNSARFGLAYLAVPDAPSIIQESETSVVVTRNRTDGSEVTGFQITSISGGALYLNDAVTPIREGDFITVAQGSAGLRFFAVGTNASIAAVSALSDSVAAAGTTAATLNVGVPQRPVFRFDRANYSVNEGGGFVVVSVRKIGAGAATVSYRTVNGTAIGGLKYQSKAGTLSFAANETTKTLSIGIVDEFQVEGDEVFGVTLTAASGGAEIAYPSTATITIVDNDIVGSEDSLTINQSPNPLAIPPSTGVLVVTLDPVNGQWRLAGDDAWHSSGSAVGGLTADFYEVELRPQPGYQPPKNLTVAIEPGTTNWVPASYDPESTGSVESGYLRVMIQPPEKGQWQLQGEATWREGGETILRPAGYHTVVFKDVTNLATPRSWEVQVIGNQTNEIEGDYAPVNTLPALPPELLSLTDATTTAPYLYNGQIQTRLGFGSGVVVKPRVVLTAAHVLFDDRLLSYVTDARWFFRKQKGEHEPVPQTPRGWVKWDGYAAARTNDIRLGGLSPGESSPASQNLDAAAMYFVESYTDPNLPGRGGYGGYLSSDALNNEWLASDRLKMLVGYPLDRISETNHGKMHATAPMNVSFSDLYQRVFATMDIKSYAGNSGGPLYVQFDDGRFYPAGIYLGGAALTLVRAIDREVVDLMNRAEILGNEAGNHTGGGVSRWEPGLTTPRFVPGLFRVNLAPSEVVANGGWRVKGGDDPTWIRGTNLYYPLIAGPFNIEFEPVRGYSAPPTRPVKIVVNQTTIIDAAYNLIRFTPPSRLDSGGFLMTLSGGKGRVYSFEGSSDLVHWTNLLSLTNWSGTMAFTNAPDRGSGMGFYRAKEQPR